jgi:hypothetical protein
VHRVTAGARSEPLCYLCPARITQHGRDLIAGLRVVIPGLTDLIAAAGTGDPHLAPELTSRLRVFCWHASYR